ncbi:MAG: glycine zipper family protein, partial [Verrucomicrobiota bacterium]|nr:glycine zipper family protein [Verrucomicrobiota bacterium]
IIGHNNGRRTAEGAAIGAGAGLLLGSLLNQSRREESYYSPAPAYGYSRPHHAVTGAVLGGIAGGVIGHNNGRHTAEGIAIGAGTGLLLGAIAEAESRRRDAVIHSGSTYVEAAPAPAPVVVQTISQPVQQVTIIKQYPGITQGSAMSSANSLFGR